MSHELEPSVPPSSGDAGAGLIPFFLLACVLSWAIWIPAILGQHGWIPFQIQPGPVGSFGPALAAIVTVLASHGPAGLKTLLHPLLRWKVRPGWYLLALLLTPVSYAVALALYRLDGGVVAEPRFLDRWYLIFPLLLIMMILLGPLGEEIGWRGFALPRLQQKMSPLLASLAIAAGWLVWHLPLFWMRGAVQEGTSVAYFAGVVVAESLIFTWIFNGTGESLLMAVLYHTFFNTTGYVFGLSLAPVANSPEFGNRLLAVFGATALTILVITRGRLGLPDRK